MPPNATPPMQTVSLKIFNGLIYNKSAFSNWLDNRAGVLKVGGKWLWRAINRRWRSTPAIGLLVLGPPGNAPPEAGTQPPIPLWRRGLEARSATIHSRSASFT